MNPATSVSNVIDPGARPPIWPVVPLSHFENDDQATGMA
jgi:hypothetical protein